MANSDKNIVITPNTGSTTAHPKIAFSAANTSVGAQTITLNIYPTDNGTLSFEGSNGQLFSITNSLSGTIYSVNDISGIPSIEVMDSGLVKLAQYGGNVSVGNVPSPTYKLDIHNGGAAGAKLFRATYNNSNYLYGYADGGGTGITNSDPHTSGSLLYFGGGIAYLYSGSSIGLEVNGTSARSHIFYDRNDTGYYIDPNSSSKLNTLNVGDVYSTGWFRNYGTQGLYNQDYGTHFYALASTSWGITGNGGNIELQFRSNHQSTIRGYVYGDTSSNFGLLNQNGSWKVRVNGSETEIYDYLYANDVRPYIIYDRNNTNYYVDPNSHTYVYSLRAASYLASSGNIYTDSNYGYGLVGVYSSYRYQGVFAMGDAYKLPADGTTTGSLYGMAWSHPNAGGVAGNLASHGLLLLQNGAFMCSLSTNIVASGNITAYSDERLKTNWKPMPNNFVENLSKVKVGIYERTDQNNDVQVGVSAQSLQKILPEAIMTSKDDMETLSISYGNAALASAVEISKEIVSLKQIIQQQQLQIDKLLSLTASK